MGTAFKKNKVIFATNKVNADKFEKIMGQCDYNFRRSGDSFIFPVPRTMDHEELTNILEGQLDSLGGKDVAGEWSAE